MECISRKTPVSPRPCGRPSGRSPLNSFKIDPRMRDNKFPRRGRRGRGRGTKFRLELRVTKTRPSRIGRLYSTVGSRTSRSSIHLERVQVVERSLRRPLPAINRPLVILHRGISPSSLIVTEIIPIWRLCDRFKRTLGPRLPQRPRPRGRRRLKFRCTL